MNFKVGDRVVIIKNKSLNKWLDEMMKYEKCTGTIEAIDGDFCVRFSDGDFWYYDSSELIHERSYLRSEKFKRLNGKRKKSIW